ncbi:MAG: glycosyltransferase family 2 protein, partial [Fimbriimonadaceae bacterium]
MPRVTVGIGVYNGAETLAACLTSVQRQSYRDFDILVIDDGSTDASARIAEDMGCRVIRQENAGLGAVRKRLVEEAEGELLAFIDHDDYWAEDKLERQVDLLARTGSVLVHTNCAEVYDSGERKVRSVRLHPTSHPFEHLLPNNKIVASSALFVREAMLAAGNFIADTRLCSDWYGWFVLAPMGSFTYDLAPRVLYTVRGDSLANSGYKFHDGRRKVLEEHIIPRADELLLGYPLDDRVRWKKMMKQELGVALSAMAREAMRLGRKE